MVHALSRIYASLTQAAQSVSFNLSCGDHVLDKPKLKRPRQQAPDETAPPKVGQAKPAEERFVLRVDGQAKRSFSDKAEALRRGQEIKKSFPVVVVTVLDPQEGSSEVVEAK